MTEKKIRFRVNGQEHTLTYEGPNAWYLNGARADEQQAEVLWRYAKGMAMALAALQEAPQLGQISLITFEAPGESGRVEITTAPEGGAEYVVTRKGAGRRSVQKVSIF